MRPRPLLLLTLALAGCAVEPPGATSSTTPTDPGTVDCGYPNAPAVMALNEPLPMFRWADARHRDGRQSEIKLRDVFCDTSADIDWSPFDVLLFVSIPAW